MHELVVVVADLYLSQESLERHLPAGIALPGFQHAARFGARSKIAGGWRPWLARWLTADRPRRQDATSAAVAHGTITATAPAAIAHVAPATVAAARSTAIADASPAAIAAAGSAAIADAAPAAIAAAGSAAIADAAPATIAAAAPAAIADAAAPVSMAAAAPATVAAVATALTKPTVASMVWIATPVHLVAGLTSVHLDCRSILRLNADDATALAADFQRVFHDSGFTLQPLESGDFLLFGPQMPVADRSEPARLMGGSVADAQRGGIGDPALRRLGAEIEMWLHEHAVNHSRSIRGEISVTGLWLWGGGPLPAQSARRMHGYASAVPTDAAPLSSAPRGVAPASAASADAASASAAFAAAAATDIAFGRDAYLQGLWASIGEKVLPLPRQLADVFGYPRAGRAALVLEIGSMLHSHPAWTLFEAAAQIDHDFIAPAVAALTSGGIERLVILANDRQLTLRARDRFKLWRRTSPGLSGLQ